MNDAAASIVEAARALDAAGLNSGTSGNVSLRTPRGLLITPTGIPTAELSAGQMVEVSLDGAWQGSVRPSSEWAMHAAIYRAFPAAQAVVHAHPDHCVALSCQRRPLPAFHYMVASFGGADVRCAEYAPFGSAALGEAAVAALQDRNACLLANHGMICHGPDLKAAMTRAIKLEVLARQYLLAGGGARPVCLSPEDMAEVAVRYRTYGQQPAGPAS